LTHCKYDVSPYAITDVPELKLNEKSMLALKESEARDPAEFRIAFISDTHNYYDDLAELVARLNQENYKFVIAAGDITNLGLRDEFEETNNLLYRLTMPFITVVGNHDLLGNGSIIYKKIYGDLNFTFTYKNVFFVFFNNNNWE